MTQPENNPPSDSAPAPPGKTLRTVRATIAIALIVGVGVFGVFAINELSKPTTAPAQNNGFGASTELPGGDPAGSDNSFIDLAKPNPRQFIPIQRENPHPGEFPPYADAAPYGQPPYQQPTVNNEVWEFCAYRVKQGSVQDVIAHYHREAINRGLKLQTRDATSNRLPGGTKAVWSNGARTLELTARPMPVQPPLRPELEWVVKYSYPEPADTDNSR